MSEGGKPGYYEYYTGLIIGCATEVRVRGRLMVTPGGIDVHVHFESPAQAWEAMSNGLTTMLGAVREPKPPAWKRRGRSIF